MLAPWFTTHLFLQVRTFSTEGDEVRQLNRLFYQIWIWFSDMNGMSVLERCSNYKETRFRIRKEI